MADDTSGIQGIHHVTAIASDPQLNLDFYAGFLGLRLVKQTVNFEDSSAYHFYYGDGEGRPGTLLTFFPLPRARRGIPGTGQVSVTSFSVPEKAMGFWIDRLKAEDLQVEKPRLRFDEEAVVFYDPDGLPLELVAHEGAEARPPWVDGPVAERHALRGLHSVALAEKHDELTIRLLTEGMGWRFVDDVGHRKRFAVGAGGPGAIVDILHEPDGDPGRVAAGSVHHVAFRLADDAAQLAWRDTIDGRGLEVTPVKDRQYFHSIYFREPGGVLFELATDPPGFTVDEALEELGASLRLPPWLEPERRKISLLLPPIEVPKPERPADEATP